VAGNTLVDVRGTNFAAGARVLFGESEATQVEFVDASTLRCRTPSRAAGPANVLVVNPMNRVGLLVRGFTYQ
jgi:hypothetical protein